MTNTAITIRNWQFLRALAVHGSVCGAARNEHHSESVVRRNIKALADACAADIICTEDGVTRLTEAGRRLLDRFALIEGEIDLINKSLDELLTMDEDELQPDMVRTARS